MRPAAPCACAADAMTVRRCRAPSGPRCRPWAPRSPGPARTPTGAVPPPPGGTRRVPPPWAARCSYPARRSSRCRPPPGRRRRCSDCAHGPPSRSRPRPSAHACGGVPHGRRGGCEPHCAGGPCACRPWPRRRLPIAWCRPRRVTTSRPGGPVWAGRAPGAASLWLGPPTDTPKPAHRLQDCPSHPRGISPSIPGGPTSRENVRHRDAVPL